MGLDHLIGRTVTATLPAGTTITGILRPPHTTQVHVIDIGGGDQIMLHPEQANLEEVTAPTSTTGRRHILADYQAKVTDTDWATSRAIHEAAHAVVGMAAGLTLETVWVEAGRSGRVGGEARFEPGVPQALAVHLVAGPAAQAKALAELGYEPLVQAAVEGLAGQGDHATIATRLAEGHVIWKARAERDARALLGTPEVWKAVRLTAEALLERGSLTEAQVRSLIGDPAQLASRPVWIPDL